MVKNAIRVVDRLSSLEFYVKVIGSAFICNDNNVIFEEKNLYNGKGEKIGVYYVNEKLNCELSEDR